MKQPKIRIKDFNGKDWSENGEVKHGSCDAKGNAICYSHKSLWKYLESEYKK